MSSAQVSYLEDGFVVVEDLLSPAEAARADQGITDLIGLARQRGLDFVRDAGSPREQECKLLHRFYLQYVGVRDRPSEAEAADHVRKLMWFADEDPFFHNLATKQSAIIHHLAGVLRDLPLLMQSMAIIKPARIGVEEPPHQDAIAFAVTPMNATVGLWIALDDADEGNGCMHVVAGGHRRGPRKHENGALVGFDRSTASPTPLARGSALLFSGLLPHYTPVNRSRRRRRALQFHYRGSQSQLIDQEAYRLRVFTCEDGQPAGANPVIHT